MGGVEGDNFQKRPPSVDGGAHAPLVPFPRQRKGNSGLEVETGVWVGSGQLWKSPDVEGVFSGCVYRVGVLPEGRQRWHDKGAETQKASVLGGHLPFQPMSQKAELGISQANCAQLRYHTLSPCPPIQLPAFPWAGSLAPSPPTKDYLVASDPVYRA